MKQKENLTLHPGSPSSLFYTTLHINVEMKIIACTNYKQRTFLITMDITKIYS